MINISACVVRQIRLKIHVLNLSLELELDGIYWCKSGDGPNVIIGQIIKVHVFDTLVR